MTMFNKDGAVLIECIIYSVILTWLAALSAILVFRYTSTIAILNDQCKITAEIHLAFDAMLRDISTAQASITMWPRLETDKIIFNVKNGQIGWFLMDNRLVRYAGTYDKQTDSWTGYGQSLVLGRVDSLRFVAQHDSSIHEISAIHIHISSGTGTRVKKMSSMAYISYGSVL